MEKKRPLVSAKLKALTPEQQKALARFAQKSQSAIPQIVKIVEKRRALAAKSRRNELKR